MQNGQIERVVVFVSGRHQENQLLQQMPSEFHRDKMCQIFFFFFWRSFNVLTKLFSFFFFICPISLTTHNRPADDIRIYSGILWNRLDFSRQMKLNCLNSPLLHTLLSSNCPLESLSLSSWRCKWCDWWWWWWWLNAKLWCKWCRWLLLLLLFAVALRSRGLCGDGDRPFSTRSRPKCNAVFTLPPPPPPRMSVIMKRERDGSTAIEPRCIGTVMPPTVPPFDVNSSAELLMVAVLVGLSPDECHCSTILTEFYWHAIHKKCSAIQRNCNGHQ